MLEDDLGSAVVVAVLVAIEVAAGEIEDPIAIQIAVGVAVEVAVIGDHSGVAKIKETAGDRIKLGTGQFAKDVLHCYNSHLC
jgi:hypothetical protein